MPNECGILKVKVGGEWIRLFDYDCDGVIRADGPDRAEIEFNGRVEEENVAKLLKHFGLNPSDTASKISDLEGYFKSVDSFLGIFNDPNEFSPKPREAFQRIQVWCQSVPCVFKDVSSLIRNLFSKQEALSKADQVAEKVNAKISEFLKKSPDGRVEFVMLSVWKDWNEWHKEALEKSLEGAGMLCEAFGESKKIDSLQASFERYIKDAQAIQRSKS